MKKLVLAAALAAASLGIAAPVMAQSAPQTGVSNVERVGDIVYVQVSTPEAATLEIVSGSDVFQASIPAGSRRVGIPVSAVSDLLDDRHDDVFLVRFANGTPSQVGFSLPATSAFQRIAASDPYRVSYKVQPGDEAELATHGFIIPNN